MWYFSASCIVDYTQSKCKCIIYVDSVNFRRGISTICQTFPDLLKVRPFSDGKRSTLAVIRRLIVKNKGLAFVSFVHSTALSDISADTNSSHDSPLQKHILVQILPSAEDSTAGREERYSQHHLETRMATCTAFHV